MAPASITKKHIVEVELVGGENLPDATHSHEGMFEIIDASS